MEAKQDDKASKVIILTSRPTQNKTYHTAERIQKVGSKLGYKSYIVYSEDAYIIDDNDTIKIYNIEDKKGFEIDPKTTLVMNRGSVSKNTSSRDLVAQLEKRKFFCVNSLECIKNCADKYKTALLLADMDIPSPRTILIRSENGIERVLEEAEHKFPLIIKTLRGSKGVGVFKVDDEKNLKSILQTLWAANPSIELLAQSYIEADGDYRIHVMDEKVLASMKRTKVEDDFRSNFSLGGEIKGIKDIPNEMAELAIKAAKAVRGRWVGIDIIQSKKDKKYYVLEVNSSPGSEGIEKATHKNIVELALKHFINKKVWTRKMIECGWKENVFVEGLGYVLCKFDTGNSSMCVMHADKWKVKDNDVVWSHFGKKMKNKLHHIRKVSVGGLREYEEDRPVIYLDVTFNGETFKDHLFCLDSRENRTPGLISHDLITKAGLIINPSEKFLLSLKDPEKKTKISEMFKEIR